MKIIKVTITGTKPILLHNPEGLGATPTGKKQIPTPEEEAKAGIYWMPDKTSIAFPGFNIFRSLVEASRGYKVGKSSATPFISGCIEVAEEFVPFGTKDYSIDRRRAVVQRNGVVRSRPRLEQWSLAFTLLISDDIERGALTNVRAMLEEAGRRKGIGDFRVGRGGPFGKFVVSKWAEQ